MIQTLSERRSSTCTCPMSCFSPESYSCPDSRSHLCRGLITPYHMKGGRTAAGRAEGRWRARVASPPTPSACKTLTDTAAPSPKHRRLDFEENAGDPGLLLCGRQPDRNLNRHTQGSFEMSGWRPSLCALCHQRLSALPTCLPRPPEIAEKNKNKKKTLLLDETQNSFSLKETSEKL